MSTNSYDFAFKLLAGVPFTMRAEALEALVELVRTRANAQQLLPDVRIDPPAPYVLALDEAGGAIEIALDDFGDDGEPSQSGDGASTRASNIGVIPVRGSIKQHGGTSFWDLLFGGTSCDGLAASLRSFMADDQISAILIDIDSGGGSSYGVFELAETIMAARGQGKPIVAIANSVAASAAYAIGVAADAFYCTPGGLVGSVGVYYMHQDLSKMAEEAGVKVTFIQAGDNKTRGNSFEPLSEEDVAFFQSLVDETYGQFLNIVAKGRGTTVADVKRNYGQGDVLIPSAAKAVGMIDDVLTFDEAVRRASSVKSRPIQRRGARAAGTHSHDRQADAGEEEDLEDPADAGEPTSTEAELEARRQAFRRTQFRATNELAAASGAPISTGGS